MGKEIFALDASKLKIIADELGVLAVLINFCPDVKISLPIKQSVIDMSLDELDLSVRSYNGLKRANINNVGDIVNIIMSKGDLYGLRNIGAISNINIIETVLCLAYNRLNDTEKEEFWRNVINDNEEKYRAAN